MLNPWVISFDPKKEPMEKIMIWEFFPSFPLHFWSMETFTMICNKLGFFSGVEDGWQAKEDYRMAQIRVGINLNLTLSVEMELLVDGEGMDLQDRLSEISLLVLSMS